ncbi:DNA topoisomerase I [Candidatus Bathyarchaeota archaeon]|nr:DNA topoisomerase I [Candidatus Bathyarchaeota archaeon]
MSLQTIKRKNLSDDLDKIFLKNYALIVTEKPDAAKRMAFALDLKGEPKQLIKNNVSYYIAQRDKKLVIVPTIGHLYTIIQEKGKRNNYPIFNFKWVPRYQAERGAKSIQSWIKTFSELSKNANEFISACDYDVEGSLIGYFILKYACNNKEIFAKRMKFSTLMKSELEKAYENSLSELDFGLIEAGKIRHEVDWIYGINLSRALTLAVLHWSGRYSSLSTGRVQGPTLHCLTKREKAICNFVPVPYWEIVSEVELLNSVIEANYDKRRIKTRAEAELIVEECKNQIGEVTNLNSKIVHKKPLFPFDIGSLQHETFRLFGFSPNYTLVIAQRLYLGAMISYPRTDSQKLSSLIDFKNILLSLGKFSGYKRLASKILKKKILKPLEGVKEDPAHPAIYPTGKLPDKPLKIDEKRVWDLIVRRFMAVFCEDALLEYKHISLNVKNHKFLVKGIRLLNKGWMKYYQPFIQIKEKVLPLIKEGDRVSFQRIFQKNKFTHPPSRFNPSSILKRMENLGIGTKTTRANIIQTLYNRKYIQDQKIMVTELGFSVIEILNKYVPIVTSLLLTHEIENKMDQIQKGKLKGEEVLSNITQQLLPPLENFKKNEDIIGEFLSKTTERTQLEKKVVGSCPTCKSGELVILHSRKTRKRFIGCTNYFKDLCDTSFSLPQRGIIKTTKNLCKICGWSQVLVRFRSRKSWNLCFNPNCTLGQMRRRK